MSQLVILTGKDYTSLIVAAIAALISFWVAYHQSKTSRKISAFEIDAQTKLAEYQTSTQKELERLKSTLEVRRNELDARREYEYEARKRLYTQCEPLLFQLHELSGIAIGRIINFARAARQGNLDPATGWLSNDYYFRSTLYQLIAPSAVFFLLRRQLTLVDLGLDAYIKRQYRLAQWLYSAFIRDYRFACSEDDPTVRQLPYDPSEETWKTKPILDAARCWRQGLYVGHLDMAAEALCVNEGEYFRIRSFGEFDSCYADQTSKLHGRFEPVATLFTEFHPFTRPVLWRILIAQAFIYRALRYQVRQRIAAGLPDDTLDQITFPEPNPNRSCDWRSSADEATDEVVLIEPFKLGREYLRAALGQKVPIPGG